MGARMEMLFRKHVNLKVDYVSFEHFLLLSFLFEGFRGASEAYCERKPK
jgi:hypothetical protein